MEVYILDSLLRRDTVVDIFESLIWTERYSAVGDFELVLHSTAETRGLFTSGTWLAMNESYRIMKVETVENNIDADGKASLKVTGRSLESILESRVARGSMASLNASPQWVITGTPGAVARKIFHDICVTGTLDVNDKIPFIFEGNVNFPDDTIAEPTQSITASIDPTTVYQAIKDVCDMYDLGFRLTRNADLSQLYFDVYSGSDRTSSQTSLPAVIFSPDLDNLQNTTELNSVANYKNVAYVFSPVGYRVVYADGVDPSVAGFDRNVLVVKADDITTTDTTAANAAMDQRGKEELSKTRSLSAFDGELKQFSTYKYGVDYQLGDLVEMRNTDGITNRMRVTEQIFVSDREGERSYPTLTVNKFIEPGTWLAWDFNQHWLDLDASTTTWADQI